MLRRNQEKRQDRHRRDHLLATTLLYGGRFAEGYAIADDLEQAQGRVFRRCGASSKPRDLRREANITQIGSNSGERATIPALGSDYAGAASANPVCRTLTSYGRTRASAPPPL